MHALLDITRTCASCVHHAGIGHGPGTRRSGQLKDAAMCHGPWAEPDLWSQTDMPHASLRYSLAVNVNLERSLSFLICIMGMRTLPLGRLRALTARKHIGYPWYPAGPGTGQEHCYSPSLFLPPRVYGKTLPEVAQSLPEEDTSSLGPFADAPHVITCLS